MPSREPEHGTRIQEEAACAVCVDMDEEAICFVLINSQT